LKPSKLRLIAQQFFPNSLPIAIRSFGNGHINDTYRIIFPQKNYLLQRINHSVFSSPKTVMENIQIVADFLEKKDYSDYLLKPILTQKKHPLFKDNSDSFWRVFPFFEETTTLEKAENPSQAYEAAKAFGSFSNMLNGLNINDLKFVIPDFHNGLMRWTTFRHSIKNGQEKRIKTAKGEIQFLEKNAILFKEIAHLNLPLRVTHNDTKISNILFDKKREKAIAVIDWDTIMPGIVLSDFGDMVRTFGSAATEDETDLNNVFIQPTLYEAIEQGYLEAMADSLHSVERSHLKKGAKWIILMQAVRFLGDYLMGDVYYKTAYDEHNLVRARNQIQLLKGFELM